MWHSESSTPVLYVLPDTARYYYWDPGQYVKFASLGGLKVRHSTRAINVGYMKFELTR